MDPLFRRLAHYREIGEGEKWAITALPNQEKAYRRGGYDH